jgi:hypothetical protein
VHILSDLFILESFTAILHACELSAVIP